MRIIKFFKEAFNQTIRTTWILLKIMIPVSIIIKLIQELNLLHYIGDFLSPVMKIVGLPGETAIVWATAMMVNIYGGLLAYVAISSDISLNYAQLSVLFTMVLVAHNFPIELQIASKAGIKLAVTFLIRFLGAVLIGITLNLFYSYGGFLQDSVLVNVYLKPAQSTIFMWVVNELKNYAFIALIIFTLIVVIKFLTQIGVINWISKILEPVLKVIGIRKSVIPLSLIGLTLGLAYGGALIIEESKKNEVSARDVFYSLALMGLCHSLIEDSLLVYSLGGDISGILFARIIFAFLITFIIVKTTSKMTDKQFNKWFIRKKFLNSKLIEKQ